MLLLLPASAQPANRSAMEVRTAQLLREYRQLGKRSFETKWPGGKIKEKYDREPDGTYSYAKLYPTGGFAIKCQRKPSGLVTYERWSGSGTLMEMLHYDERTTDYTAYWPNGSKAAKYLANSRTREVFCEARDPKGKQTYPRRR